MMPTTNQNVSHGKANGSLFPFVKVILKRESSISIILIKGEKVKIVDTSEVKHIVVKSKKKEPEIFHFEPIKKKFTAKYPLSIELRKKYILNQKRSKLNERNTNTISE